MRRYLLTLLILSNLIGYSQTADIVIGCAPLKVQFAAPASSNTYYWDFKDGVTSDKQKPSNLFLNPGTYDVEFRNASTGPIVGTLKITILSKPKLDFTIPQGCAPYNGTFVNTSVVDPAIVVTNYKWAFGDGQSFVGLTPPTHIFPNVGSYNITMQIEATTMPSCADNVSTTKAIEVLAAPVPSILSSTTISCDDQASITFTSGSTGALPMTYSWVFGNGATSTDANPAAQTFKKGQFNNTLSVSYANMPSCKRDNSVGVSIGRPNPKIIFSKDSICPGMKVNVKSSIAGFLNWDYTTDAEPATSLGSIDSVKFNTPGIHTVKLTVTSLDGQCSGSVSDTLFVYDRVTAAIEPQPLYACERPFKIPFKAVSNQTGVKYEWKFNMETPNIVDAITENVEKNYTRTLDTNKYDINKADTIYALLKVTSKNQCVAKDTVLDIIQRPTARMVANKWHGCVPLEVQFGGRISVDYEKNRITSLKWNFDDGLNAVTTKKEDSLKHTFTKPGVYEVTVEATTERGCKDTSYVIRIEVGDKLDNSIDFSASKTEVCIGEPVTFTVTKTTDSVDAYHFSTEANRSFHCSDEKSLTWAYNYEAGSENVSLEVDYNGCLTKKTKLGLVNNKGAVAKLDYAMDCRNPSEYNFKDISQNATSVMWSFGDDSTSTKHNTVHRYNDTISGDYIVRLVAQNGSGCKSSADQKIVKVRHIKAEITLKDTLLCSNSFYDFSAALSKDMENTCLRGFTWQFPDLKNKPNAGKRPFTTNQPVSSFVFSDSQNVKNQRVWLIAQDVNNCKDTAEARFSVYAIDVKSTASRTEICIPNEVEFVDKSTSDTTLVKTEWLMGDGKKENGVIVTHLYNSNPIIVRQLDPNLYEVAIKVTDALGCSDSLTDRRIRKYVPTSTIVIQDNTLCLGDTAKISATDFIEQGSTLKYTWNFGNGKTSTTKDNPIVYEQAKRYDIKMVYEEVKSGCKDSSTSFVDLQSKPVANFTTNYDTASIICAPKILEFTDSSVGAFTFESHWNFVNDGIAGFGTKYDINLNKGPHKVIHRVFTSYGCSDTTEREYKLFRPEGNFIADKTAICKGETINFEIRDTLDVSSFTWVLDGKEIKNLGKISHKFDFHPLTGQTDVKLDIKGFNDRCSADPIPFKTIKIHQVISDYQREDGIDTSICFNNPFYRFINKSSGNDTFAWDFGDGQTSTTDKNPVHKYNAPGAYKVSLSVKSNALGCVDTLEKMALVTLNPVVQAVGDTICQGQGTLKLFVANPHFKSKYKWTPSTDLSSDTLTAVTSTALHTTVYQIIETDSNNCQGIAFDTANVIEPLGLGPVWDTIIILGDKAVLPAYKTPMETFHWNPTAGLSCLQCNYPWVRPLKDTVYNLSITDVLGCNFNDDVVYTIKVRPETFVKMPTVFTPNSDGNNDIVNVNGWGIKELLEFKIFNRWGQMLYSSNILSEGWDGKFNGNLQNSDVYVYKVKVKTWTDKEISHEGYINLVH